MNQEEHCRELASAGAIMTVPGDPERHFLIGHFEWIGANRILWFNANGSDNHDVHVLEFDRLTLAADEIGFIRVGRLVGHLALIDAAPVEDRDDYRIASQIWEQIAPAQHAKIRMLVARHEIASAAQG